MRTSRRTSLTVGFAAITAVVVVAVPAVTVDDSRTDRPATVSILADEVGDGVAAGTSVTLDGVRIGEVADIENTDPGVQRLRLDLTDMHGLTDGLSLTYAPANLFGITTVALTGSDDGTRLHAGSVVDLTGGHRGRVIDATMGAMLRRSSTVTTAVATPDMSRLVYRLSADLRGFTPFLTSMVSLARTAVEHRRMSPTELLDRLGSATESTSILFDATVQVIDRVYRIDVLRTDRERIRTGLDIVTDQLFPALGATMRTAGDEFSGFAGLLVPPLRALSAGASPLSADELTRLLANLRAAMPGGAAGPVLNVDLLLAQTPAVSQPLLNARGGRR